MDKLKISQEEISQLMEASLKCDTFLQIQYHFLKAINSTKINSAILRFKMNQ